MAHKILIIEDSSTFRTLLTTTLRRKGYEVVGADTGLAGIQAAKDQLPNLISLDLSLPDISGAEVLSSLKADLITRQIPVIVCTACVDGCVRGEVLRGGAAEILTKPVKAADLFAAVDRCLDCGPLTREKFLERENRELKERIAELYLEVDHLKNLGDSLRRNTNGTNSVITGESLARLPKAQKALQG